MASGIFNNYKARALGSGTMIDLDGDTIKVALVTSSYTPDFDAHDFFNDVTNEVSATGYTAGGATLANKTLTQDNTDNEGVFDADNPSWTITGNLTARGAVVYKDTGVSSTSPLICYIDFGQDYTAVDSTFTINLNAEGLLNLG